MAINLNKRCDAAERKVQRLARGPGLSPAVRQRRLQAAIADRDRLCAAAAQQDAAALDMLVGGAPDTGAPPPAPLVVGAPSAPVQPGSAGVVVAAVVGGVALLGVALLATRR